MAKVGAEEAVEARVKRQVSYKADTPAPAEPLDDESTSEDEKRIEVACAKVFGRRQYDDLSSFEKLRVDTAAIFEFRAVDYTIIVIVVLYSIIIFFSIALESEDCNDAEETWQESASREIMPYLDAAFLSLFMIELLVKSFAYGLKFFQSAVTIFDATIVTVSLGFTIFQLSNENESSSALVTVLRLGRIVRVILILMKLNATQAGLGKLKYRALESGVEAPVYKVLSLLQELSLRVDVETDRRHIAWICEVIGSNRLYTAVISGKAGGKSMDTETEAWLKSQYRVTAEAAAGKPAQLKRSSLAASVGPDDPQRGTYGIRGLTTEQEASLASILAHVESWSFDVFELHKASGGQPLVPLVMTIFHRHDFFDRFRVRPEKMASALCYLQAGYAAVPYHNRLHASDVTQTLYSLLLCDKVSEHVSDLHLFAAVLAAAVHDFGHPGLNNLFHVKNRLEVAVLYNDQSVLEHMHISRAWALLNAPEHNIFASMLPADVTTVREMMICMVLGTDMSGHFDELAKFMTKVSSNGFEAQSPENTKMVLKMALHCADVSNPAKSADMCLPWAARVMEEFFMQGDKEKSVGLPPSPFMDRENTPIAKCQGGFIKIIVTPLYEAWSAFAQSATSKEAVENCNMNLEQWNAVGDSRIDEWAASKQITREDAAFVDHGPISDPLNKLPPIKQSEERYYYDFVVQQRAGNGPPKPVPPTAGPGGSKAPPPRPRKPTGTEVVDLQDDAVEPMSSHEGAKLGRASSADEMASSPGGSTRASRVRPEI